MTNTLLFSRVRSVIASLFLAFIVGSCTSETESKGVDAVLAFYGGKMVYAKGLSSTTKDKMQGRFYELKLSGVAGKFNQYFTSFQLPASNCAYLFYHALSPEERQGYSFIRVIIDGDNIRSGYEFATQDLAQVDQSIPLVAQLVQDMRSGSYDRFLAKGNALAASSQDWQKTKPTLIAVDQKYGSVKEFSLQGFELIQRNLANGAQPLIRLVGVLVREKQNTDFSLVVASKASQQTQYLYGFRFSK